MNTHQGVHVNTSSNRSIKLSTTKFNKINLSLIYMYRKTHISILPITVLTSHLLHVF